MNGPEIPDAQFRAAVSAIDAGDVGLLDRLLAAHPDLVRDRLDFGECYFRQPYLLWFVAENPIRNEELPANIGDVTRAILRAVARESADSLKEQVDYALALVCSGRVPRECGVQRELIDILTDAGADPGGAMLPGLAHRELAAVERLLERGAELSLLAAACMGRARDVERLARAADAGERHAALVGAALHGRAEIIAQLIDPAVDLNAYSQPGFHPHGTALHHAVDSGSLAAVRAIVEAGARLDVKDKIHDATPLEWAEYLGYTEIANYLRATDGHG